MSFSCCRALFCSEVDEDSSMPKGLVRGERTMAVGGTGRLAGVLVPGKGRNSRNKMTSRTYPLLASSTQLLSSSLAGTR